MSKLAAALKNELPKLIVIAAAVIISIAAVLFSGFLELKPDEDKYSVYRGKVLTVDNSDLSSDVYAPDLMIGNQQLSVRILTGKYKNSEFAVINPISRLFPVTAEEGSTMLFRIREDSGAFLDIDMYGYDRANVVYLFVGLFLAVLIVVGRKKGFYAIVSLAFTVVMVIYFMIPLIMAGVNPITAAVLTSALTTVVTILLVSGFNRKSTAAIAGIIAGVGIAGIISYAVGFFGHLSGLNLHEAEEMLFLAREYGLNVADMLFCGIIISSLGAVMDVGMSIASAVFEVHSANPSLKAGQLYKSGMNVGRDVMGTMSNTLILAFAGGSLNTIILIILYRLPYIRLVNLNLLGLELLRGISGSIGIILTVPITAVTAAILAHAVFKKEPKNEKKR